MDTNDDSVPDATDAQIRFEIERLRGEIRLQSEPARSVLKKNLTVFRRELSRRASGRAA